MTMYNKSTLKTFFETGDVPDGGDYANLIDSNLNLSETAIQSMSGPLATTEIITPRVSATNVNITGVVSAISVVTTNINATGIVSAATVVTNTVSADALYASAAHIPSGVYYGVGIVSALGTAQAAAAPLTFSINRGQGTADGQTTGFALQANRTGLIQYLIHEGTVSGNLWPPTGGTINALSTNVPFPLVASTQYTIIHKSASAYAVK